MKITAKIENVGEIEEIGTSAYVNYDVALRIDGEEIGTVTGWLLVGWLAAGASGNLDGSGLDLWGDSQPGGWTQCDGDGESSGVPKADDGGYDEPISVASANLDSLTLEPETFPAWAALIDVVEAAESKSDTYDAFVVAEKAAQDMRNEICEQISEAISGCGSPYVDEPESEAIWDDLPFDDELPCGLRVGDYRACGVVMVWQDGDEYRHTYSVEEGDVERALDGLQASHVAAVMYEVREAEGRDDT